MRLQNLANEEFGSSELWAGFGPPFLKPIGINETKEMLMEKYAEVPVKRPTPATSRSTATSTGRRTSCGCRCTTC